MSLNTIDRKARKLVTLTVGDIDLVTEALDRAASRHESMARFNPRSAKKHDDTAAEMRKLRSLFLLAGASR